MSDAVRLDKWLWAARFFKTRSLASQAVRGGKIEINGASPKPSRLVRVGDRLRISRGELVFEVIVEQLGERRVSAPLAREMYAETEAGRKARERQLERLRQERVAGEGAAVRPDKRQRRQIRRLVRGK
jgi:ribosome-associated heat shock protein Hsp15